MKESQQFVTLDTFNATLERLIGRFDGMDRRIDNIESNMATKTDINALESKMMQGFDAFDSRLNSFESSVDRRFKIISGQIQSLTLTKADWQEE